MKQTAVEWLEQEYMRGKTILPVLLRQAKEIEKQQIQDAVDYGTLHFGDIAEDYYNETFDK